MLKGLQPVSVKSEREFRSAGSESTAANPKQGFLKKLFLPVFLPLLSFIVSFLYTSSSLPILIFLFWFSHLCFPVSHCTFLGFRQ